MLNDITDDSKKQVGFSGVGAGVGAVGIPDQKFDHRGKHQRGIRVGKVALIAGEEKRAMRYFACGTGLGFGIAEDGRHLIAANFCHQRLCATCESLRALKNSKRLAQVLLEAQRRVPDIQFLMLTLTQRNCGRGELTDGVDRLIKGWARLMRQKAYKSAVLGAYRTVEITRNPNGGDSEFHPHIHALIGVPARYFGDESLWIDQQTWRKNWRRAARLDYLPQVRIQALHRRGRKARARMTPEEIADAAKEGAKYVTKDEDIFKGPGPAAEMSEQEQADVWAAMFGAVFNRRLTAYSGLLKKVARALKCVNTDNPDLIDALDEHDRLVADQIAYQLYEWWRWGQAVGDYTCTDILDKPTGDRVFFGVGRGADNRELIGVSEELGLVGPDVGEYSRETIVERGRKREAERNRRRREKDEETWQRMIEASKDRC